MQRNLSIFCLFLAFWSMETLVNPPSATGQVPPAGIVNPPEDNGNESTQTSSTAATKPTVANEGEAEEVEFNLSNARAALRSFLSAAEVGDYAKAARALDFASMDTPPEQTMRENLAFKLAEVITSMSDIDAGLVSDDPTGEQVRLPANAEEKVIEIERSAEGQWRFTPGTVDRIEALYGRFTTQSTQKITEEVDIRKQKGQPLAEVEDLDSKLTGRLDSPRETMQTFLTLSNDKNYGLAARTMDFSLIPVPPSEAQKANLAWKLKEVIDRMQWVDYTKIPTHSDGEPFLFPVSANRQPIIVAQGMNRNWRFTRETVARIDDLYDVWRDKPKVAQSLLPHWMRTPIVAGNEGWRIVGLFLSILVSLFVAQIARWITQQPAKALRGGRPIVASFFDSLGKSIAPLLVWIGVWVGIHCLVVDDVLLSIIDTILQVLLVVAVAHILYRLVDVIDTWLCEVAEKRDSTLDDMLAPFVRRSIRATVAILALVQIASILSDKPPASIIAGLGVASIAIGLAAQDTIKNFFGSVMLLTDRPFEVGDRVVIDGHDGPVEEVGFRSTRIRTLEGHLVTVPNGELANRTIQNIGKRPHIRRTMNLTITYDTLASKIELAVEILKEILADHEGMHQDFPPRVYFNDFNDTSLNIFVIYWYHPADYWAYCAFSERVNLSVFQRFEEEGIEFAYPTQTVYLASDPKRPLHTANNGRNSNASFKSNG